jgi:hypothetical protein
MLNFKHLSCAVHIHNTTTRNFFRYFLSKYSLQIEMDIFMINIKSAFNFQKNLK